MSSAVRDDGGVTFPSVLGCIVTVARLYPCAIFFS
jgi:hypothetical protein